MRRDSGFTLVELMIVVAIIGILAAIAYPSYMESVAKSRRAAAKNTMMRVAQQQERYYTEKNTYTATLTDLGYTATPIYSDGSGHAVTVAAGVAGIATSFVITAVPQITDSRCGNLTLNNLGQLTPTGC